MTATAEFEELSEITIASFEHADVSPNKIVTRSARRILSKGFDVTHICEEFNVIKPFAWGRSSEGKERVTQWNIQFFDDESNEFLLVVRLHHNISVVKRNPHDKKAPSREPVIVFIPKDRETAKALGMKLGETIAGA